MKNVKINFIRTLKNKNKYKYLISQSFQFTISYRFELLDNACNIIYTDKV